MSDPSDVSRPYVVITGDAHAGASLDTYREYLDPGWREEFDAWRASYRNPARRHLGKKKTKNWNSAERIADLERDGVVAEVVYPNTVPPFYDRAYHVSPLARPEQYPRWLAGTRAHNRWLADFCSEAPERRAGVGLIHLNDIDDAIRDVEWIARHGLRGGVLLPLPAPSDTHLKPLHHRDYDRLWAAIQDHDLVMNQHSGQGTPDYGDQPGSQVLWVVEMPFYIQRGLVQLIVGGVFERFPRLKLIVTESGCAWVPSLLARLDGMLAAARAGMIGEIDTTAEDLPPHPASVYARRNCWYGASFPHPRDIEGREVVGVDRILWGNDYPHYEGCWPYSRENMRLAFADVDPTETRMMLGENAAALYGFDLEKLRPVAEKLGITPDLVSTPLDEIPADSACPTFQRVRFERARAARG